MDGTYTVTVDQPLTGVNPLVIDVNVQIFSAGTSSWSAMQPTGPGTMFTFPCKDAGGNADSTKIIILDTPNSITAAQPFNLQQGYVAIM